MEPVKWFQLDMKNFVSKFYSCFTTYCYKSQRFSEEDWLFIQ